MFTGRVRILFIIFSLDRGGAEKIFSFLANNIDREKFEIHFLTISQAKSDAFVLDPSVRHMQFNFTRVLFSIGAVYKYILTVQPTLILSTLIPVNILVGIYKKFGLLKKVKCILRESSIPSINGKFSKNRFFFYNSLISNLYKEFDVIVAQSFDMKKDLIDNYHISANRIQVINNPFFENNQVLNKDMFQLANSGKKIFISIGNLRVEKGHLRLLDAIVGLKGKCDFELWIVGDGIMRQTIEERIIALKLENEVKLLGHQQYVYPFLERADLYLQTSAYEGFPNVLLEAMGMGIPVVAYDVLGGTKDIVVDGLNGFLVKDGDEKAFCSSIVKAIDFPFDKDKIKEHVKLSFSASSVINKYEELFFGILNK